MVVIAGGGTAAFMSSRDSVSKAATTKKAVPPLEFGPSDLTMISNQSVARSLTVSGTLVAVNQTTVKAKVAE